MDCIIQKVFTFPNKFLFSAIYLFVVDWLKQLTFFCLNSLKSNTKRSVSPKVPSKEVNLSSPRSLLAMAMKGLWLRMEKTQP